MFKNVRLVIKVVTYHKSENVSLVTLKDVVHAKVNKHVMNAYQVTQFQVMVDMTHQYVSNVTNHVIHVSNIQEIVKPVQ